jgi:hypothetical protein
MKVGVGFAGIRFALFFGSGDGRAASKASMASPPSSHSLSPIASKFQTRV